MEIIAGIYKIEDIKTGNVYVGKADKDNGIKKRWSCHKSNLKAGRHTYNELQQAYDDNPDRIKWEILEENYGNEEELIQREQYWIDYCKRIDGWNVINRGKAIKKSKVKDTSKMKLAQTGENNGNCKYNKKIISNILWLKMNGYKAKEIEGFYKDIKIKNNYIYSIGVYKWIHLEPTKPSFIA